METYISPEPVKVLHRGWVRFHFGIGVAHTVFVCKLDGGPYRRCSSPQTYRHLSPGRHVFRVRPQTPGPNRSALPAVARFRVLPALRDGHPSGSRGH